MMGQTQMSDAAHEATEQNAIVGPALEEQSADVQPADSPGKDENGDGLTGGQATADTPGDVLGI